MGRVKDFWAPDFEVYLETVEDNDTKSATRIATVQHDSVVEWEAKGLSLIQCRDKNDADSKLKCFKRK